MLRTIDRRGCGLFVLAVCCLAQASWGDLKPYDLRCESRREPLGLDTLAPRLSWKLESDERGRRQTAWQVRVAGRPDRLADAPDIWDSGRVEGDQQFNIVCRSREFASGMACHWQVRVWDDAGDPSEWSAPARWTFGLLNPADWRAQWIGPPRGGDDEPFEGAQWIWFDEGDPTRDAPGEPRWFRYAFEVSDTADLAEATLFITADNYLKAWINDERVVRTDRNDEDAWRKVRRASIGEHLVAGRNVLVVSAGNVDGPAGLLARIRLAWADGRTASITPDAATRALDREPDGDWTRPDYDDADWPAARVLGEYPREPWGRLRSGGAVFPVPHLRTTFELDRPVRRAWIHATALGVYELELNGRRVGEDYLTPGWTDYHTRLYYNTYEVTELLREGENAWGGLLGPGWYAGHIGLKGPYQYGHDLRLRAQLQIEFDDGGTRTIATGPDWRFAWGPILDTDLLMGEIHDARRELTGWGEPGFDAGGWAPVELDPDAARVPLSAYPGDPVRRVMELPAIGMSEPEPGAYIFDLGQNMVGVARIKVRGPEGARVRLRHGERLEPDGRLHTANLRSARATDHYTLRGADVEVWAPRFTTHGFRFVELTYEPNDDGARPEPPTLESVTGLVMHADMPIVGAFETDNELVNQLAHNIEWGLRGNHLEVPTDCPQRDERLGWTGDALAFMPTAVWFADLSAFYTKWLIDLNDAQRKDGAYPDVAPWVAGGAGTGAWGDAGIGCQWVLYQHYADTRLVQRHYPMMRDYLDYLTETSDELVRPDRGYGDGVAPDGGTPKDLIGTAWFAQNSRYMAEMAAALNRDDEAARYRELNERIRAAWFDRFSGWRRGVLQRDTQTGYALALAFDLVPAGERREAAFARLLRVIEQRDGYLSTGFVGTPWLPGVLSDGGRTDVAYRLLLNEAHPSWGYMISHGATTIWERWNGVLPTGEIHEPGMNSFNHYAFGCVGEWLFEHLAGIQPLDAGLAAVRFAPEPGPELTYARAEHESIRGKILSEWRRDGTDMIYTIAFPPGVAGTVSLSAAAPDAVTIDDRPWTEFGEPVEAPAGRVAFALPSGRYAIRSAGGVALIPALPHYDR